MRLSDFILDNMEAILTEWESFAATLLPPAGDMTSLALRDHAPQILRAIAKDITTAQTRDEQAEKSKGRAPSVADAPETAAQTHAVLRARSGFNIVQLVAEYRALRATVMRLWLDSNPLIEGRAQDVTRFNEAIDQAIAESVGHFHAQVEMSRNLFLGMLGHDMRTPLSAIVATASYLSALNAGEHVSAAAARLIRSGASMQVLLDDLVDFNRAKLGLGLNVVPESIDLAGELGVELEQLRAAHSGRQIEFVAIGDSQGHWDSRRLKQVLRNLVCNALEHGFPDTPVSVTLVGEEGEVRLEVANQGRQIDAAAQSRLFDPLARGLERTRGRDGLGLGLFIVREIVIAHGGRVAVNSDVGRTIFAVSLPRREAVVPLDRMTNHIGSRRYEPARVTIDEQTSSVSASGTAANKSISN